MNFYSVLHKYIKLQQDASRNDVIKFNGKPMVGNKVYCPMCDEYHLNDTFCQISGSDL
jgi:hypothetical protein